MLYFSTISRILNLIQIYVKFCTPSITLKQEYLAIHDYHIVVM